MKAGLLAAAAIAGTSAQTPARPDATPAATTSSDCPTPAVDTRRFLAASAVAVNAPRGTLALVPVASGASRERGLMCVVRIPPGRGMLFVFAPPDQTQGFWMKNTLVALDMVFVRGSGVVSAIAADVPPTPFGTSDDAVARRQGVGQYVIELGAGDAARHRIDVGTKLDLPNITAEQ